MTGTHILCGESSINCRTSDNISYAVLHLCLILKQNFQLRSSDAHDPMTFVLEMLRTLIYKYVRELV